MDSKELAIKIVDRMYNNDPFSQWLGIERLEDDAGRSVLRMEVSEQMLNGMGIAHGGITYSLADSALAFAANSRGKRSLSVETSITHIEKVREGDVLTAVAEEVSIASKIGKYHIVITNQDNVRVALFEGKVYRTDINWTFPKGSQ